mmetsp:Transcript_24381/g.38342  ORF Transcript_24381/g.38342 Transcript_24381/m.38342 type:complete len:116 (+) Transcript_24381:1864-2211(+)
MRRNRIVWTHQLYRITQVDDVSVEVALDAALVTLLSPVGSFGLLKFPLDSPRKNRAELEDCILCIPEVVERRFLSVGYRIKSSSASFLLTLKSSVASVASPASSLLTALRAPKAL